MLQGASSRVEPAVWRTWLRPQRGKGTFPASGPTRIRLPQHPILQSSDSEKIKFGTCAWSFEDWRGVFYPEHLPSNQWLGWYSRFLPAVEIDSTFYSAPAVHVAGHWLDQTPENFRVTCKMPREITHERKLRDCAEPVHAFLDSIAPLHEKLGCVLIQLPPFFSAEHDDVALARFIEDLPRDFRYAVEFRHSDWRLPRIVRRLEEFEVCWVWNDLSDLEAQNLPPFELLPQTTDFLYVRLMGDSATKYDAAGARLHRYTETTWARDVALDSWAVKIEKHLFESREVFVLANNHYEGFSPATCQRIARRLGVVINLPGPDDLVGPMPGGEQLELL